jgi:hypothetical protein
MDVTLKGVGIAPVALQGLVVAMVALAPALERTGQ